MTETPTKPRTRKLKRDKPLTEAEEKELQEFEHEFVHLVDPKDKGLTEGCITDGPALCGKMGPFEFHFSPTASKQPICPLCQSIWDEMKG